MLVIIYLQNVFHTDNTCLLTISNSPYVAVICLLQPHHPGNVIPCFMVTVSKI